MKAISSPAAPSALQRFERYEGRSDAGGALQPNWIERSARQALRARLRDLREGSLTLVDGDRHEVFGTPGDTRTGAPDVTIRVHDPRFYSDVAFGGSVGAGESYMRGDWSVSDGDQLTCLVQLLLRNRDVLDAVEGGMARLTAPLRTGMHWLARNSRDGSRRNIAAHYDLGNPFFELFLDPTMMYSSAVFERDDMTLEQASIAKLERICRKLELEPEDHVIEIGTGWGGFAIHAARYYGCRVTTTTISREQHDLAVQRIAAAGLADRITVRFDDYRDLQGQYDKLVSIEMIEAVGHRYFDTYFAQCSRLLKPSGRMVLQAITIADQRYDSALKSVDFIQKYIFPGCCIPSVAAICDSIKRRTDLRLFHVEDIGPHYATTLKMWRENLLRNLDRVRALGYPESFIRMWVFYLCYCEGGFAEQATGDVQMVFVKPRSYARPVLGSLD